HPTTHGSGCPCRSANETLRPGRVIHEERVGNDFDRAARLAGHPGVRPGRPLAAGPSRYPDRRPTRLPPLRAVAPPTPGPPAPALARAQAPGGVEFVHGGRPGNWAAPAAPGSPASGMKVTVLRAKCADPIPMELPAILPVKNGPDNPEASAAAQSTGPSLTDP